MFSQDWILGLIKRVVGKIEKSGTDTEKEVASMVKTELGLVEQPKVRAPKLVVNEKRGYVTYADKYGHEFTSQCAEGDTFDKYVGASIALGRATVGKNKFERFLAKNYNMTDKKMFETYAMIWACNTYGGKKAFIKMVDELLDKSGYFIPKPTEEKQVEQIEKAE